MAGVLNDPSQTVGVQTSAADVVITESTGYGPFGGGGQVNVTDQGSVRGVETNVLTFDVPTRTLTSSVNGVSGSVVVPDVDEVIFGTDVGDLSTLVAANTLGVTTGTTPQGLYRFNGTSWLQVGVVGINDLSDVTVNLATDDTILITNGGALTQLAFILNNLSDVSTTGATTNQVLTFDGSEWVSMDPQAVSSVVAGTDITVTETNDAYTVSIAQAFRDTVTGNETDIALRNIRDITVNNAGDEITITKITGDAITFTDSGGTGNSTVSVNGTEYAALDFTDTTEVTWTVNTTNDIVATIAGSIARVANIVSWARAGNTDLIPAAKLPAFLLEDDLADWAFANSQDTIPDGKLNTTIARANQLATFQLNAGDMNVIENIVHDTAMRTISFDTVGTNQSTVIQLDRLDIIEWQANTNYELTQPVYILGNGIWVRIATAGASDPRTDTDNWSRIAVAVSTTSGGGTGPNPNPAVTVTFTVSPDHVEEGLSETITISAAATSSMGTISNVRIANIHSSIGDPTRVIATQYTLVVPTSRRENVVINAQVEYELDGVSHSHAFERTVFVEPSWFAGYYTSEPSTLGELRAVAANDQGRFATGEEVTIQAGTGTYYIALPTGSYTFRDGAFFVSVGTAITTITGYELYAPIANGEVEVGAILTINGG